MDSGTSYATPFVAATAALVRSRYPALTAAQVKRRLEVTADHPGTTLPDPGVGWGIVNPYNAVMAVLPEESGAVAKSRSVAPITPQRQVAREPGPRDTALTFGAAAIAAAIAGGLMAYLLPRAIRRRWRPADEPLVDSKGRP